MAKTRLELLGEIRIKSSSEALVQLSSRKLIALLVYLALYPGERHSRTKIASLLWAESNDAQSRQSLRQTLASLRKVLPDSEVILVSDNDSLQLKTNTVEVDVLEFTQLAERGQETDLEKIVDLYRGDFLDGFCCRSADFEDWVTIERSRLREIACENLAKLIVCYKEKNNPKKAIALARKLLVIDSLNEPVHRDLMLLYAQLEDYSSAIKQYRKCQESLMRGLGIDPDSQTQKIYQQILQNRSKHAEPNNPATDRPSAPIVEKENQLDHRTDGEIRILVVDDDSIITNMLNTYLSKNGYEVYIADCGDKMREVLAKQSVDVALLDIGLPGEDGLSLARYLREHYDMAIIMVTAADDVVDKIVGLEVGADDYIAKPFDPRELRARIKSVIRRYLKSNEKGNENPQSNTQQVHVGHCKLDLNSRHLLGVNGDEIPLSNLEFELLKTFTERPYQVLSRDELSKQTQNREWHPFDRSMDIRIARIRQKIESNPDNPTYIKTVRGKGYMYVPKT